MDNNRFNYVHLSFYYILTYINKKILYFCVFGKCYLEYMDRFTGGKKKPSL